MSNVAHNTTHNIPCHHDGQQPPHVPVVPATEELRSAGFKKRSPSYAEVFITVSSVKSEVSMGGWSRGTEKEEEETGAASLAGREED